MDALIKKNIPKIHQLCKIHGVESLSLFGSAAKNELTKQSDVDFLVRFSSSIALLDYADNYFNLLEKLKNLFKRKVDLVSEKSLKNPILIKEINDTKVSLYNGN